MSMTQRNEQQQRQQQLQRVREADWMMQQRREEYRVAPLARPIVKSATPTLGGAVGTAYGLLSKGPSEAETLALQTTRQAVTSKIGPFERPRIPTLPSLTQKMNVPSVGIAESLANIQVSPLIKGLPPSPTGDLQRQLSYVATGKTQQQQIRPFAGFAGLIAPAEATVYSVGQLFGYKTPNIPATIIGSPARAWGYGPEYVAGSMYGEVFLAYGLGKAQQKLLPGLTEEVTKPITRPIQERASDWLTERAIERGPLESASLQEKIVMLMTGAKPHLAQQVVAISPLEAGTLRGLEQEEITWEVGVAPKSSVILFSEQPSEKLAKAWAKEHLLKTVTGGLAYATVREELAAVPEPKMPNIPKTLEDVTGKNSLILLPRISTMEKTLPYLPETSKAEERQNLGLGIFPILSPLEDTAQLQSERQMQQQLERQELIQQQKLMQVLASQYMFEYEQQFTFPRTSDDSDYLRRFAKKRNRGRGFMGLRGLAWPVPSPESLLTVSRRRRRKK